ncbi:MAG: hypothetical protein ABR581_08325 [Thermoleophilaceae bacterium]
MWPAGLVCLALAAVTLLLPSTPTYDPWAWVLWGREITHLDLVTTGGPSWKPLPILFTTVFSLFGKGAAPYLWLWMARAGGLFACFMAFRVARRLVGTRGYAELAGVFAALALFSSFKFVRDAVLGNSDAMLAAAALLAFERHRDGRRDHAFYLGFAGALLRPEAWPFLGLYGLWLWFREPRLRVRMVILGLLVPALWFLPEWWGSGNPFRAGERANNPNAGSVAFADHPALELAKRFWKVVIAPVKAGAVIGTGYALRNWLRDRREGVTLAIAACGLAWFCVVAAMSEAGFAGNQRYLIVSTAVVCVLGGVGVVRALQGVAALSARGFGRPQAGPATALAICVVGVAASTPFIVEKADNTEPVWRGLRYEAHLWRDLKGLLDRVGRKRVLGCIGVFSGPFQTQELAWELGLPGVRIGTLETPPPGALFRTRTIQNGPLVTRPTDDRFRQVLRYREWRLLTVPPRPNRGRCPAADRSSPTAPRPPGL